jgi:hypothetical protein
MTQPTAQPGTINGDLLDRFTLAHAGVGAVYGLMNLSLPAAAVLAIGWEVVERPLKDEFPELFPHSTQDTLANAALDAAAVLAGWWLVKRGRR